jgi:bacillolysin
MKKIIITGLLLCAMLANYRIYAQEQRSYAEGISEPGSRTSFIHIKKDLNIPSGEIFTRHANEFGLQAADELRMYNTYFNAATGLTLERFQQYYNGIKVHGAVTNVYSADGFARKTNGRIIRNITGNTNPLISESSALQNALAHVPSNRYKWTNPALEQKLKAKRKNSEATYFPKGELIYMYKKGSAKKTADDYELCWKFPINVTDGKSQYVFVSAISGKIVNSLPIDLNCDPVTVALPYNGNRTIYTSDQGRCFDPGDHELWDDCYADIKVEDDDFGAGTDDPMCAYLNHFELSSSAARQDGMQVLWGMRSTYLWYSNIFNWNSYDNSGGSVDCTINFQFESPDGSLHGRNAQYNEIEEDFDFGYGIDAGDPSDSYTCLDIVAHEFTHGVDDYTADLDYSDESGALDESFADIFGEAVEVYTDTGIDPSPWLHGEDKGYGGRSFFNPKSFDNPDTYLGDYWCDYNSTSDCSETDHGGVHTNSSVQNHFFYLLTQGDDGVNDNGTAYDIQGIGWNDAIYIAFVAHTYLWGMAGFIDARDAWLEAAIDLFGSCSNQAIQVGNAWHAVGVGSQSPFYDEIVIGTVTALASNTYREAIHGVLTAGAVNINSTSGAGEVRFYAGETVVLNPGFTASSGSAFVARTNPCSFTIHTAVRNQFPMPVASNSISKTVTDESLLQVSPNPFNNEVRLNYKAFADERAERLTIVNSVGELVFEELLNTAEENTEAIINTSTFKSGVYFIRLQTNQRTLVEKTVKME